MRAQFWWGSFLVGIHLKDTAAGRRLKLKWISDKCVVVPLSALINLCVRFIWLALL